MNTDRYFRSSSFPLTAFLFSKGEQVTGINQTNKPGKKEFVFLLTPRLEELVDLYQFGEKDDLELFVNVNTYEQGRRQLLDKLNS